MSDVAIRVENLGKRYCIGALQRSGGGFRYKALRDVLADAASSVGRRALSPFRGSVDVTAEDHEVWALKDVSFDIKRGEAVGIIGRNGAGKSTLLKILSRITEPTEGYVRIEGRVGSLLEVGTGFHPELTGRENIFLNGAILGMKKSEIERKFDEIVAFAEVERFIDTAVKHFSSGMYLRLAFAVAAHLEPEILLVDEVLAVGDAQFQKKCLGKMGDVAREGRTVLFVSHNMGAVGRLCREGMLLDAGRLVTSGNISGVIAEYTQTVVSSVAELRFSVDRNKKILMRAARLLDQDGRPSTELDRAQAFSVSIEYEVRQRVAGAHIAVMLDKVDGTPICHAADIDGTPGSAIDRVPGLYTTVVEFPGGLLNAGAYQIRIGIAKYGGETYDYREGFVFRLSDLGSFASLGAGGEQRPGVLALPLRWTTENSPKDGQGV
jgi:lipopolysaccharide transport system ATP-binding protein